MTDQMPDEEMSEKRPDDVWTDGSARTSGIYMTYRFGAYRHRYIRADLYEHIQRERDALADSRHCIVCGGTGVDVEHGDYGAQLGSDWCDSCEAGKALRDLDERAEQVEADRDRLRAVLSDIARDGERSAVAMRHIAQEALDHD